MPYLDKYQSPLTSRQAAHLLRRATFGPTPDEITQFTGLTAQNAVQKLFDNVSVTATPPPPVVMDQNSSIAGQTFMEKPFDYQRRFEYSYFVKYWWIGLMADQNGAPSILEKLTAFWQNHFVTTHKVVEDYRYIYRYLMLLRSKGLGSFKTLTIEVTKDPSMLVYQNGNENEKDHPNENYGRELQELFTVGQRNKSDQANYTEEDVKQAARVLTGWQAVNQYVNGSTTIGTVFNSNRHDSSNKQFSHHYNNKVITGRSGPDAGNQEINELVDMLLAHPEAPKFICRKLYRWYVNTNVTDQIETNVIAPLAAFFASPANNYAIGPVLQKLLTSEIFFDRSNLGAIVKSPAELAIGSLRLFKHKVPHPVKEYAAFRDYAQPTYWRMVDMQLNFLDQPLVFGSLPYYQTGYSMNWINASTIGMRRKMGETFIYPYQYHPGYTYGIDFLAWVVSLQPNFSDVDGTPCITCEQVFEELSKNLFANELFQSQKDFLIDKIMMQTSTRSSWTYEFNAYRRNPSEATKANFYWRLQVLMKYMVGMAEFQVF
ncbi:DUF1800 family protein [Dyadobacter sp. CY347]|uniref:DUF1800 domain-containing protein n=1 Tax=Dyadobacter sp. CY347 TaxID=2909336 RepID=UPI001F26FE69|nr:DUF1800 family protein [Dyadobacter sp. CY347]MCF2487395.1 DUF1800 domain-containing protein [Dyadobacter sp. CY347]